MSAQSSWTQRIARTQMVLSASWQVLKKDKTLLLLPVASSACLFLIVGSYLEPLVTEIVTSDSMAGGIQRIETASEVGLFLLTVAVYTVGVYFNATLASCVLGNLEGKAPTIVDGLREAFACLPQIVGWALLSSTVGLLLRAIEPRSGFVGHLVVKIVGMAWGVATFLVVPILVVERKGPIEAVQGSVELLKRTWGENLLAGVGFGGLYFLLSLPGVFAFIIGAGLLPSHLAVSIAIMALSILYFPLLGLVLSTLSAIFDVVLYRYAKLGTVTPGFDHELLESSFVTKRP